MPKITEELGCSFADLPIEKAYGEEVHTFLHTHLRGYDRTGEGKAMDSSHYDKYGAPCRLEDSWMEGYHCVEKELGKHFNQCANTETDFPIVAAMAGGAHLYQPCGHDEKPWDWTGFVPLHSKWLCNAKFFPNRHFMTLRGNEIQNNLWDYHPHEEEEGEDVHDDDYVQISPVDAYKGGYWYKNNPWARYLHIISLKTHVKENKRYNYIVHPLAYRSAIDDLPDNTVDGVQWSIMNIAEEEHFVNGHETWGDRCHGMEIFNDFTYYYSWNPNHSLYGIEIHNGEVMNHDDTAKIPYIFWFDTYPFEFCEFLIDSALRRGVYLHILSANDAFYDRATLPPSNVDISDFVEEKESHERLMADPKGRIIKRRKFVRQPQNPSLTSTKWRKREKVAKANPNMKTANKFLNSRPYKADTAFGYTTLIDTNKKLKEVVFGEGGDLNKGELHMIDYLIEGKFYAHTGVYDLFNYDNLKEQTIPFVIQNQPDKNNMCYEITANMELIFNFEKCKENKTDVVWKYHLEMVSSNRKKIEVVSGYFKLDNHKQTQLNLTNYDKNRVKYIRFTAFKGENPHRRAWFNPIRGLAFGAPLCNDKLPPIINHIAMCAEDLKAEDLKAEDLKAASCNTVDFLKESELIEPYACASSNLNFWFEKCTTRQEENIYGYYMQVPGLAQNITLKKTKNTTSPPAPRIMQNVHGYFTLNDDFPTRLDLSHSWDAEMVMDRTVYFYAIDTHTGKPMTCEPKPSSSDKYYS